MLALALAACNTIYGIEPTELARQNHYPCDCECSGNVRANGAPLHVSPGGAIDTFAPADGRATVLDGPEQTIDAKRWWKLRFVVNGIEGWVEQTFIELSGVLPVFAKRADVCLPPEFNYYLGGTQTPTISDLQNLCSSDIVDEASTVFEDRFEFPVFCQCAAESLDPKQIYEASCGSPCPDGLDVCLVQGSDPPDPVAEPLSAAVFQPTSECLVAGDAVLTADGHTPKEQPHMEGVLQIHGRACPPNQGCRVGISWAMSSTDIEFDSGTIFADDPKFVEIGLLGASEPDAVNLGPFLGGYLGEVPAGTAFSSAHGRRSGSSDGFVLNGRNNEGLALAVGWDIKFCRIGGELVGQAKGDGDEGTFDAQLDVGLEGPMVNQPPRPNAGSDRTEECTSPNGAAVTLDASGSTDPDGNIALYEWRRGSVNGPQLATPSLNPVVQTQQALGSETYHLVVADSRTAADRDSVAVTVADTTAAEISCNAPATIVPSDVPEKRRDGISFTATAQDLCTGVSSIAIESVACTKPLSCRVGFQGATLTIYDSGGVGDVITWIVAAQDGTGNVDRKTCTLTVVKKK